MHLLRSLWFFIAHYDIQLIPKHIPGVTNKTAHHLSLCHRHYYFLQNPHASPTPSAMYPTILQILHSQGLDWTSPQFHKLVTTITKEVQPKEHIKPVFTSIPLFASSIIAQQFQYLKAHYYYLQHILANRVRHIHTTLKVYLAAIRNLHVASRNHQAFYSQLTPHLQQVLRHIKKDQANRQPQVHLPITLFIMRMTKAVISSNH